MEAASYKCPTCSASLIYNIETRSWKCNYCSRNYNLEELGENEKKFNEINNRETIDVDEYTCSSCGAKIITDENTTATFCAYCGNTAIIKNRIVGLLKPDSIIPFKFTKDDAIKAFLKFKKDKPFTPKEFGKEEQIAKITPIYIPFWLFDYYAYGKAKGTGYRSLGGNNIGPNIKQTKTELYNLLRFGSANFKSIPVDGGTNFDDSIMNSIEPFEYSEKKEFSPAYLSGVFAEKYDVSWEQASKIAEQRVEKSLSIYFEEDMKQFGTIFLDEVNIDKRLEKMEYLLLPVYMMRIKYGGKFYYFAMNGQTGKMVGNLPMSEFRVKLYHDLCILGVVILFGILFFISRIYLEQFSLVSGFMLLIAAIIAPFVIDIIPKEDKVCKEEKKHNNVKKADEASNYMDSPNIARRVDEYYGLEVRTLRKYEKDDIKIIKKSN